MSGHSKWHNIQAHKSVQDAKKSKFFTKVTKELMLAAKAGGADTALNTRLKSAIAAAKAVNLPRTRSNRPSRRARASLSASASTRCSTKDMGRAAWPF